MFKAGDMLYCKKSVYNFGDCEFTEGKVYTIIQILREHGKFYHVKNNYDGNAMLSPNIHSDYYMFNNFISLSESRKLKLKKLEDV